MPAAHFLFIPAVLLIGLAVGGVLGSRAAADEYAVRERRDAERAARRQAAGGATSQGGR
jgi:hypothetical protein